MTKPEVWERPDGAHWKAHDVAGGKLVLTSQGQELMAKRPEMWRYLRAYRAQILGSKVLDSVETRQFFASGGNSTVYKMAPGVVVKEAEPTGSALYSLERMDRLFGVIEMGVPRWIDMPHHYGILTSRKLPKEYVLQQQIDSGITVDWLLNPELLNERQQRLVQKEFGVVSDEEREKVRSAFHLAQELVSEALTHIDEDPASYLTDYHEGNVLVERLRTPVARHDHKLWIIDQ